MNRTRMIVGILILLIAASWVTTFVFFKRLPSEIPIQFSLDKEIPGMGPKWMFFIFPGISTFLGLVAVGFYFFRKHVNFIGKNRLKGLPQELTEPVYNRVFQIALMNMNFSIMLIIYVQVNIALYTLGRLDRFNYEVMFVVVGIIIVYSVFSIFTINKMTRLSAEFHQKWLEEKDS